MKFKVLFFYGLFLIQIQFINCSEPLKLSPPETFFTSIVAHFTDPITGLKKPEKTHGTCLIYSTEFSRISSSPDIIYTFKGLKVFGFLNKERGTTPDETDYVFHVTSPKAIKESQLFELLEHAQEEAEKSETFFLEI